MAKRIRVLYTIPNFDTAGSGKSVYDLVKGLNRNYFDPEICCFHNRGAFFKEVEKLDVKIHLFPFTAAYRPKLSFMFRVLKISKFFKDNNFDLIHSWHWSSDISEPLAAKLSGIPYVYTKKAMGWQNRYWSIRSKLSAKIIAVNEDMMTQYFSKMLHKVECFPLAIDVDYYNPDVFRTDVLNKAFLKTNDFVIISVANLVPVKGIEILLEAVHLLKDKNIKVLIVGHDEGEYGEYLKQHYSNNENFVFLGKQLDVRPYLNSADLFVIPTKNEGRKEGIPNAPLEAMAMRCPVIGSNISGISDILSAFPECLFEAGNINDLSIKLKGIKQMSSHERNNLAHSMRLQVIKEYSIEDFIQNHEVVYKDMIS